jgi:dTDP-4-dehydrorhamnose 3,5-epimerase
MRFEETPMAGAYRIEIEPVEDLRGLFARTFCAEAFEARGLPGRFVQCNVSYNRRRGTLRGLHFQHAPHEEGKLVRCTRGTVWDAIVDIRPASPTCGRWYGTELSAENRRALFVPAGFAHGFVTLCDDAEVFYQMSTAYRPGFEGGIHHADPTLAIDWPIPAVVVSPRDAELPKWTPPC